MTLGCTPNLFQNKANTKPMGRVKWTSSHSSVSLDLNDACNNSLNVAIIWIYGFTIYGFTIYGFTIYEFTDLQFTNLRIYDLGMNRLLMAELASSRQREKLGQSLKSMM